MESRTNPNPNPETPRSPGDLLRDVPVPPTLGAALLESRAAFDRFTTLSEEEKRAFLGGAQNRTTGYETRDYVRRYFKGDEER